MKKQKSVSIEEIESFALAYQGGEESDTSERAQAIIAEATSDGKKFAEKAGKVPQIVPFLLDYGLISRDQIMEYYLKISWLDYRDIILELKAYESGTRKSEKSETAVMQNDSQSSGKTDAQLKAEWKTEKCEDGTLRLLSYKGMEDVIIIPEKIGKTAVSEIGSFAFSPVVPRLKSDMKPVRERIREIHMGNFIRAIGESCFEGCLGLQRVILSDEIRVLPKRVFADCHALTEVELPKGLTTIGCEAFTNCKTLTNIRIPDHVETFEIEKIGWGSATSKVFYQCIGLKSITLPKSIKVLPKQMLDGCRGLETIQLPDSLEEIEDEVFQNCGSLKELKLPNGLKKLGGDVFREAGVTELKIPSSLTELGRRTDFGFNSALAGSKLQKLILPIGTVEQFRELRVQANNIPTLKEFVLDTAESGLVTKDGAIYSADMKLLLKVPSACGKQFIVPDGVEIIEENAFIYCEATTIILPKSMRTIGRNCFLASKVENMLLPDALEQIPESAFARCNKLKKVQIPESVSEIGASAFFECKAMTEITVPGSVKIIGKGAFNECESLKTVFIEEGVEQIDVAAFSNCKKLEKAVIPASVEKIKNGIQRWEVAFSRSDKLTIWGVPGSVAEKYATQNWIRFSPLPKNS